MTSISVIGCGWLGLPLAEFFVKKGYKVKGSTTSSEKFSILSEKGIEPFLLNLRPFPDKKEIALFDVDYAVVNIPPRNHEGKDDYHLLQLNYLKSQLEPHNAKVIFISSTGIYPDLNREVYEKDADPNAKSRGGVVLKNAEDVFLDSSISSTVIRFGGLYGDGRHPVKMLSGRELAGGDRPVNMIHQEDCIHLISEVIRQGKWGKVYNACSPRHPSRQEFYEKAAKQYDIQPPKFKKDEKQNDFKIINADKIIKDLSFQFKY